jgi:TPR repeat protein
MFKFGVSMKKNYTLFYCLAIGLIFSGMGCAKSPNFDQAQATPEISKTDLPTKVKKQDDGWVCCALPPQIPEPLYQELTWREPAMRGEANAQFEYGKLLLTGFQPSLRPDPSRDIERNEPEGIRYITLAANQRHPEANYFLGEMYRLGQAGLAVDGVQAIAFYRVAIELNFPIAMYRLGTFLETGHLGTTANELEAIALYRRAAALEQPDALHRLGQMYLEGHTSNGIPIDPSVAVSLFRLAAYRNHPRALFSLGRAYELGQGGLAVDLTTALSYYERSAALGDPMAIATLESHRR